jgi:hypothetical protein
MGHIWGSRRGAYSVLVGKANRRDYLEDLSTAWRITLKWTLKRSDGRAWTD